HQAAREEASTSYMAHLQEQQDADEEAEVIGIRYRNSISEPKITLPDNAGVQWKPLSSVHDDALDYFLADLKEYLTLLRASNSLQVDVTTISLRDAACSLSVFFLWVFNVSMCF